MNNPKPEIDVRHLQIDDWVLYQGKPMQIFTRGARIIDENGMEVTLSDIKPLPITEADLNIIIKRLKKFQDFVLTYRQNQSKLGVGLIVDVTYRKLEDNMRYISTNVQYYHELQHLLRDIKCPLNINYRWRLAFDEKEAEDDRPED